jgi:hypothetical protein
MNLIIKKTSSKKYPRFLVMDGNVEFCSTGTYYNATLIKKAMSDLKNQSKPLPESLQSEKPDFVKILDKINEDKGVDLRHNLTRKVEVINLRYIYCKMATDLGLTFKIIGEPIHRNYASVLHALKKFSDFYQTDSEFRSLYHEIEKL